jgi:ATP-dependent Clp protease ATP-binding subunit ClpC
LTGSAGVGANVLGYGLAVISVGIFFAIAFRKELGAWWSRRRKAQAGPRSEVIPPPLPLDLQALTSRLYELDKAFGPFGSNAAHPSDLYAHGDFKEAVRLLTSPGVPLATVLQFVEGNSWSLSSAAMAALKRRSERDTAVDRVLRQCAHFSPWAMYFALDFLFDAEPRIRVGAPFAFAKDWWIDNRWMPNVFRDYLARCVARGDSVTFGESLSATGASANQIIRNFLQTIAHPAAATLIGEIDSAALPEQSASSAENLATLKAVGRFWKDQKGLDILVEPDRWAKPFALAEAALRQSPPRSMLVSGEPMVGKTSFLQLFAQRIAANGWTVFEASGADLQADQIYIGQLEGRIRHVVDELARGYRMIWYIPDIVQLALSGTHSGQSATMLDQIMPAISSGRLVVWAEATPKGVARLVRLKPMLRGLFETVTIEPLPPRETLSLVRDFLRGIADKADIRFESDCAEAALDTASQYLGTGTLPGSVLLLLKLTATRAVRTKQPISSRAVLETLSQVSGLPVSILDTKEQLNLESIRTFFAVRVLGQNEAVASVVDRIAMLKAGLNDPHKPIGVFLFAGPTGTGKTELAKAVAEFLFGSVERVIRLDMSEFQTHDSVSKILGHSSASAAEADSLISRVRKQPFSVLLLDEFETSHPMIWDLFLQAFDEGRLTDAMGQVADLRHCLIIMTSNLGATAHRTLGLGFAPRADEFSKEQVLRAISQTYRPEFQNRLDKVIVFRPLSRELMRGILKKELAVLLDRRGLKDRAWAIEWESSALEFLLERGFSPEMGARPLKRAIDQYVVAPLAAIIVEKRFPEGEQFLFVRSDGNSIQVEFVDPDADGAAAEKAPAKVSAGPPPALALASAVLAPNGTRAEFQMLLDEYGDIERTLNSEEWNALKDKLVEEMSGADFWTREQRFATLTRFSLMDRVKAAAETADALRRRLERYTRSPPRYSVELSGRLALQLYLIREGIKDAFDDAPVELALAIEPVFDGIGERQATLAWCDRLRQMYHAWAAKRRMQITDLSGTGTDKNLPVLTVSGFGVYRILTAEAGLHLFEESEGGMGRVTARVRLAVVPLADLPAGKERKLIVEVLEKAPQVNTVIRRYREEPPLVRDAVGKWRTGRLDLVLGGEFDLLQASER